MPDKKKYSLEFILNTSTRILYNHISTPSGLSEWFADDVNIKDDTYTFIWNESEEEAKMLKNKKNEFIRFHWDDDEEDGSFFEFRIQVDSMTQEVALIITDFAEEDEMDEAKELWETQVKELKHVLGA